MIFVQYFCIKNLQMMIPMAFLILNENNLHIYTFLHIRRCGLQLDNLEKKIGKKNLIRWS
jgi:hypothetical protein